jgi:hypothetical protein
LRSIPSADGCFIALVDVDELVCKSGVGTFAEEFGPRLKIDESLAGLALQNGTPFCCDLAEVNPLVDRITAQRLNVASIVSVPPKDGNRRFSFGERAWPSAWLRTWRRRLPSRAARPRSRVGR